MLLVSLPIRAALTSAGEDLSEGAHERTPFAWARRRMGKRHSALRNHEARLN